MGQFRLFKKINPEIIKSIMKKLPTIWNLSVMITEKSNHVGKMLPKWRYLPTLNLDEKNPKLKEICESWWKLCDQTLAFQKPWVWGPENYFLYCDVRPKKCKLPFKISSHVAKKNTNTYIHNKVFLGPRAKHSLRSKMLSRRLVKK